MIAGALAVYQGRCGAASGSLVIKRLGRNVSVFCCLFQLFQMSEFHNRKLRRARIRPAVSPETDNYPQSDPDPRWRPPPLFYAPILLLSDENETVDVFFHEEGRDAALNARLAWMWLCLKWLPQPLLSCVVNLRSPSVPCEGAQSTHHRAPV